MFASNSTKYQYAMKFFFHNNVYQLIYCVPACLNSKHTIDIKLLHRSTPFYSKYYSIYR